MQVKGHYFPFCGTKEKFLEPKGKVFPFLLFQLSIGTV